jgi:hypothetical protein
MQQMIKFTIPLKVNSNLGMNKIYAGKHWTKRNADSKEIHDITRIHMKLQKVPQKLFTEPVAIHISYNSKLDLDNHGYLTKMIVDSLKGYLIEDDSRKYVQVLIQDFHSGKDVKVEVWGLSE